MRAQRRLELRQKVEEALRSPGPSDLSASYVPAVMVPAQELVQLLDIADDRFRPEVLSIVNRIRRRAEGPEGMGRQSMEVSRQDLYLLLCQFPRDGVGDAPSRSATYDSATQRPAGPTVRPAWRRYFEEMGLQEFPLEGELHVGPWVPPDADSVFWTRRWLEPSRFPVAAAEQRNGTVTIFGPWGFASCPDRDIADRLLQALHPGCFDTPKESA